MTARIAARTLSVLFTMLMSSAAAAQPLGTFTWQLQPYCNRLTFTVTQSGSTFTLDGYDDLCGAGQRAAATGVATLNPNGTVTLGISIITSDVAVEHLEATLSLATLSGPWRDNYFYEGTLAFNAAAPGNPRGTLLSRFHYAGGYFGTVNFGGGFFFGRAYNGTLATPQPMHLGDTLARFGGGGYAGHAYNWPTGMISMDAAEDWTPTANGTRLRFWTTDLGSTFASVQMVVDYNGFVGIGNGSARPNDRLDVNGDLRVGTSGTNGCVKNNNGGALIGVCASDARFKHDVRPYEGLLDRVAALQPVEFAWRTETFPDRGFGPAPEAGLLAQDVEAVLPEIVTTQPDGFKAVDYGRLPLLAIQAIRELKARNDALEASVAAQESRLAALEAAIRR